MLVCVAIFFVCYYFIYIAKSPFYTILQDVQDKTLDMEVCYFMYAKHNFAEIKDLYAYCNSSKPQANLKHYHHKIYYETYKNTLQDALKNSNSKIPANLTKPLDIKADTFSEVYGTVAVFFSKDSTPMYEVRLGVCPKINGQSYEYDEDFYALLESIASIQEPQRAKRILTNKQSNYLHYATYHIDKMSCQDSYMLAKEVYFSRDRQLESIEKNYYECLDFSTRSEAECIARRKEKLWFLENEFDEGKERAYFFGE